MKIIRHVKRTDIYEFMQFGADLKYKSQSGEFERGFTRGLFGLCREERAQLSSILVHPPVRPDGGTVY